MSRDENKPKPLPVEIVVERIKKGDREATGFLYKTMMKDCFPKVSDYLTHKLGREKADVEDWYQNVFITLIKSIQKGRKFKSYSEICAYLMKGVKQQNFKDLKKKIRQTERFDLPFSQAVKAGFLKNITEEAIEELAESCQSILKNKFGGIRFQANPADSEPNRKEFYNCIKKLLQQINLKSKGRLPAEDDFKSIIWEALEDMDGECGKLLHQFYNEKISLKELAKLFDFSYGTMKNKRMECLNKLTEIVVEKLP